MTTHVIVLCKSPQPITITEIEDFVADGGYLDNELSITQSVEGPEARQSFELEYAKGRRPLLIHDIRSNSEISDITSEIAETIPEPMKNLVTNSQQLFIFEIDDRGATPECWTMADALESHVARTRDGIVYVSGEGFYDSDLEPIHTAS
jgi:hypothetical protein